MLLPTLNPIDPHLAGTEESQVSLECVTVQSRHRVQMLDLSTTVVLFSMLRFRNTLQEESLVLYIVSPLGLM